MANVPKLLWQKKLVNRELVYVDIFDEYADFFLHCQLYDVLNISSIGASFSKDNTASLANAMQAKAMDQMKQSLENVIERTNISLCYAATDCEEVGLAYGLRAHFFSKLQQYSLSLADIELAKQNNYPSFLWPILCEERDKCLKEMDEADPDDSMPINGPKFSFPADAKIPCFAQGLEVKHSKKYGSHIITTRDLKTGQTVIVEEAYCIASENAHNYSQCANCFERKANLIPCKNCAAIMFCSQKCYDIGHQNSMQSNAERRPFIPHGKLHVDL